MRYQNIYKARYVKRQSRKNLKILSLLQTHLIDLCKNLTTPNMCEDGT